MRTYETDVLVIGAGNAGLIAAITASESSSVTVVSKEPLGNGNTKIAAGLVCTTDITKGNTPESLYEDIMRAGEGINNPKLVSTVAKYSKIANLIVEGLGHFYKRNKTGIIDDECILHLAGHTLPRGLISLQRCISMLSMLRTSLVRGVKDRKVQVMEEVMAVKLIRDGKRVIGGLFFDIPRGKPLAIFSRNTILAAGSLGMLYYPHTDMIRASAGDGFALALDVGARLVDMEQVQFIPFGVVTPDCYRGIFIGEPSLGGPEGKLLDDNGRVILKNFAMMTRAEVSRIMALEILNGNSTPNGGLWLDLRDNLRTEEGKKHYQAMKNAGLLEIIREVYGMEAYRWGKPIEVAPTVHYHCGGVMVDENGFTGVEGLYAAGENQGGTHGANRIGSVSLLETIVFGWLAGKHASSHLPPESERTDVDVDWGEIENLFETDGEYRPSDLKRDLQKTMWTYCGAIRDADGLNRALKELEDIRERAKNLRVENGRKYNMDVVDALELHFMLNTGEAIALSALVREESRGCHARSDFPKKRKEWSKSNVVIVKEHGKLESRVMEGWAWK
jgi:fumarate reductase (CoM/CoB) subunit A